MEGLLFEAWVVDSLAILQDPVHKIITIKDDILVWKIFFMIKNHSIKQNDAINPFLK